MGDVLSSTVFLGEKCWRDWGGGRSWRPPQGTVVPLLSTRKRQVQSGRKGGEGGGESRADKKERERKRERREGGNRKEEMSWWKDAGVADPHWEVEDADRLR